MLCFPGGKIGWLFFSWSIETQINGKEVLSLLALSYYGIWVFFLELTKMIGLGLALLCCL